VHCELVPGLLKVARVSSSTSTARWMFISILMLCATIAGLATAAAESSPMASTLVPVALLALVASRILLIGVFLDDGRVRVSRVFGRVRFESGSLSYKPFWFMKVRGFVPQISDGTRSVKVWSLCATSLADAQKASDPVWRALGGA
jgi:hypothetical protein